MPIITRFDIEVKNFCEFSKAMDLVLTIVTFHGIIKGISYVKGGGICY